MNPDQTHLGLYSLQYKLPLGKSEDGKAGDSCDKWQENQTTVKPVLSDHSKKDKTKVLKTNRNLMKVDLH